MFSNVVNILPWTRLLKKYLSDLHQIYTIIHYYKSIRVLEQWIIFYILQIIENCISLKVVLQSLQLCLNKNFYKSFAQGLANFIIKKNL